MKEEVKQSLELIIRGLESLRLTREERAIFDNAFKILTTELIINQPTRLLLR
jgi:hypothetical protein